MTHLNRSLSIPCMLLMLLLLTAVSSPAGEPGRFSGSINAGLGWKSTKSNIEPGDDNKRLSSLSADAQSEHDIMAFAAFEINYQMSQAGRLYLGIPLEGGPQPTLGIGIDAGQAGEFDLGVFYSLPGEVWADPYLTGVNRSETDLDQYGARISWKLAGLEIRYQAQWEDVETDAVGSRLPDLQRDGLVHQAGAEYEINLGRGFQVVPVFSCTLADMDGRSNEYTGFSGGIRIRKMWPDFMLMLSAELGVNDYDRRHPVFNQTRKDDVIATMAMISWLRPLGYERLSLSLGTGYERIDSNIRFYDQRSLMTFISLGVRFHTGGRPDFRR